MKKILSGFILLSGVYNAIAQTTPLTVDGNDVLNSNNKIVIVTGVGQSFLTGYQDGGT